MCEQKNVLAAESITSPPLLISYGCACIFYIAVCSSVIDDMTREGKLLFAQCSSQQGKYKPLIYYDYNHSERKYHMCYKAKHIWIIEQQCVCKSTGFMRKSSLTLIIHHVICNANTVKYQPRFLSEDPAALLIHSCQEFSQHPAKKPQILKSLMFSVSLHKILT